MTDHALISALLDDRLDATDRAAFWQRIATDAQFADAFAAASLLEADLTESNEAAARSRTTAPNTQNRSPVSAAGVPIYRKGHEPKSAISNSKFSIFNLQFLSLAATLLAACGLAIYVFVSSLPQSEIPDPTSTAPLANLIENASDGTLTTPGGFISEGRDYPRGEYTLDRGTAEFMLTNSVNVKLRGDTRMTMRNNMNVALTRGSAEFICPADATGFTVHLPDGSRVVDLGTRFRVDVDEEGRCVVSVIEGTVRVESDATPTPPRELTGGHAVRIDADGITDAPPAPDQPIPGVVASTGGLRFLHDPPASVGDGDLESDEQVFVFAERRGAVVPAGVAITAAGEGAVDNGTASETTRALAGTVVDSYFLHFDSVGDRPPGASAEASITFDRPIVGAIVSTKDMIASDAALGSPETDYPGLDRTTTAARQIETGDTFTVSVDRRTLTLRIKGHKPDQLRVLVEPEHP